jgi:tetratricopeptide (TPR) repeat protein
MTEQNVANRLQKAQELFQSGEYRDALRYYGDIYNENPKIEEAKIGVFLCDMALESGEEAQALFDYYYLIKEEQEDAAKVISDIIDTLDESKNSIASLISAHARLSEDIDGISYIDFMKIVEERGDFKHTFEDIMFSTRIYLTSKVELMGFITQLHKGGFEKMALQYLDDTSEIFDYDQEVMGLYNLFEEKK